MKEIAKKQNELATDLLLAVHHRFQVLDHGFTEIYYSVFLLSKTLISQSLIGDQ